MNENFETEKGVSDHMWSSLIPAAYWEMQFSWELFVNLWGSLSLLGTRIFFQGMGISSRSGSLLTVRLQNPALHAFLPPKKNQLSRSIEVGDTGAYTVYSGDPKLETAFALGFSVL